jgi:hypothetical protein
VIEEVLSERLPSTIPNQKISDGIEDARKAIRIGLGEGKLDEAVAQAGGTGPGGAAVELESILRRRARAEIYLELAISQPIEITEGELRAAFLKPPPSLAKKTFEEAAPSLRIHMRATRLREASQAYYQAVRGRLKLEIVG